MKVEFIDPFVSAAFTVLEMVIGDTPERGQLALRNTTFTTEQITIMAGVTGEVEGSALYGMSLDTAKSIAGSMMGGGPSESLDDMSMSALSELANMITGHATTALSQKGFDVDITPPSIVKGKEIEVSTKVPALVLPINTKCGKIEINVALELHEARAAA